VVDRALRPVKTRLLAPLSRTLAQRLGPRAADRLTTIGLALGLAAALAAALGAFVSALVLWLANRLVDGLDGDVARLRGSDPAGANDRGGYFDLLADLSVYAALPLGAAAGASGLLGGDALVTSPWLWPLTALVLASYYVNMGSFALLAALLEKRGQGAAAHGDVTSLRMPAGLIEGAETIVLVALMLAFPAQLPAWLALTAALVTLTALQRAAWAWRALQPDGHTP